MSSSPLDVLISALRETSSPDELVEHARELFERHPTLATLCKNLLDGASDSGHMVETDLGDDEVRVLACFIARSTSCGRLRYVMYRRFGLRFYLSPTRPPQPRLQRNRRCRCNGCGRGAEGKHELAGARVRSPLARCMCTLHVALRLLGCSRSPPASVPTELALRA